MQQLARWAIHSSMTMGWAVGIWTQGCQPCQLGWGSLALDPAYPVTSRGPPRERSCTPQSLGCVQGCFPPNGGGTVIGWVANPVLILTPALPGLVFQTVV